MVLNRPEKYNFYKIEEEVKKGEKSFTKYTEELLKAEGLENTLEMLESSGLSVNIFSSSSRGKYFKNVFKNVVSQIDQEEIAEVEKFLIEKTHLENVFTQFTEFREGFFNEFETIKDESKVASYIIALELYLYLLTTGENKFDEEVLTEDVITNHNLKASIFDSAVESTGLILKYFMYKKYPFKGIKNNISPKIVGVSSKHMIFSENWNTINDLLEYWMYSEVNISILENGKIHFEILDEDFELNNLISNERFNNLRQTWQLEQLRKNEKKSQANEDISQSQIIRETNANLTYLFGVLYFGAPLLDIKIKEIELNRWFYAYELLIEQSKIFLKKRKEIKAFNIEKVCLSKSIIDWEKFFQRNDFSKTESQIIVEILTFDNQCMDLIDSPFLKMGDNLILIPSLTSQADIPRALASNFLNREINLDFKGLEFEERIKFDLNFLKIKNCDLRKKIGTEEYQCDIAFVLDNELFLVECKAHVQPYTTRQHANHLYKLNAGTLQLKRIAEFYESNIPIVNEQLKLDSEFTPKKVHRILLTTSMIGTPIFINGAFVVDESAFTMFVNRTPPTLKQFGKGGFVETPTRKFDIYEGELSAKKMIQFLKSPPQIQIAKDLFKSIKYEVVPFELLSIRRHMKIKETLHMGANLAQSKQEEANENKFRQSILKDFF